MAGSLHLVEEFYMTEKGEDFISSAMRNPFLSWEAFFDYLVFALIAVLMVYCSVIMIMVLSFVRGNTSLIETMREESKAMKGDRKGYIEL